MPYTYKINTVEIEDVVQYNTQIKEERNLLQSDPILIPDLTVVLFGEQYNPDLDYSIFYNLNSDLFKDIIFTIENDDSDTSLDCTIKSIEYNEQDNRCTLTLQPFVSKNLQNTFEYYNDDITPAGALIEILELGGLKDNIDYPSFWMAVNAQSEAGLLVNLTIDEKANKKIIDVINTMGDITYSDIYLNMNNKIVYLQYNRYFNPVPFCDITQDQIINYKLRKNITGIINNFKLDTIYGSYPNESTLGEISREKFGNINKDLNYSDKQNISSEYISGMIWAGENYIYKNENPKWIIELDCVDELDYPLTLLDFFNLSWLNNNNYEVIRITKNEQTKTLNILGVSYE